MKKLLVPFFVIMSTGYACADGYWGGGNSLPTTSSSVSVRQVIDGVSNSLVGNNASVGQLALGVGDANASARTRVSQGIYNVDNSIAVNNADIQNLAVAIGP